MTEYCVGEGDVTKSKASRWIIRPVGDLWLWWTLASIVPYLAIDLANRLQAGTGFDAQILSLASMFIVVLVLARYLGNFDWWRWVVVTVVGGIIGAIIGLVLALVAYGIIRLFTNAPDFQSDTLSMMVLTWVFLSTTSVAVAIGQWRVLRNYAAEEDRGLWILANLIGSVVTSVAASAGYIDDLDGLAQFVIGFVGTATGSLIVGYTLTRMLGKSEVMQQSPQRVPAAKGRRSGRTY